MEQKWKVQVCFRFDTRDLYSNKRNKHRKYRSNEDVIGVMSGLHKHVGIIERTVRPDRYNKRQLGTNKANLFHADNSNTQIMKRTQSQ